MESQKLFLMNGCGSAKIGCSWLGLLPSKMWLAWLSAQAKMDVAGWAFGPAKNG